MRTVAELKRLLRPRVEMETEYGRTLVELIIRRLKDNGYLNDSQYAATYSSLRPDNQTFGKIRAITELKTRGVHGVLTVKPVTCAYEGASEDRQARNYLRKQHLQQPNVRTRV